MAGLQCGARRMRSTIRHNRRNGLTEINSSSGESPPWATVFSMPSLGKQATGWFGNTSKVNIAADFGVAGRAGVDLVEVNRIAYQGQTSNPVVIRRDVSAIHLGCRYLSLLRKGLFTCAESYCGKRKNALTALAYLKAQWQLVSPRGRRLSVIASPLDVGNPVDRT